MLDADHVICTFEIVLNNLIRMYWLLFVYTQYYIRPIVMGAFGGESLIFVMSREILLFPEIN